jgi:hypothetical protein
METSRKREWEEAGPGGFICSVRQGPKLSCPVAAVDEERDVRHDEDSPCRSFHQEDDCNCVLNTIFSLLSVFSICCCFCNLDMGLKLGYFGQVGQMLHYRPIEMLLVPKQQHVM